METLFAILFPRQSLIMAAAAWALVVFVVAMAVCGCGDVSKVPAVEAAESVAEFVDEQEQVYWQAQYQVCCACLDDKQAPPEEGEGARQCLVTGERGGESTSEIAVNICMDRLTDSQPIMARPGCIKGRCGDECWFILDVKRVP